MDEKLKRRLAGAGVLLAVAFVLVSLLPTPGKVDVPPPEEVVTIPLYEERTETPLPPSSATLPSSLASPTVADGDGTATQDVDGAGDDDAPGDASVDEIPHDIAAAAQDHATASAPPPKPVAKPDSKPVPPTAAKPEANALPSKPVETKPPVDAKPEVKPAPAVTAAAPVAPASPAAKAPAAATNPAPGAAAVPPPAAVKPAAKPELSPVAPAVAVARPAEKSAETPPPAAAKPAPGATAPLTPKPAAPPPPRAETWFVQVGGFADIANARQAQDRLKAAGQASILSPIDTANGTLYRVRIGPFASREAAAPALARATSAGFAAAKLASH